MPDNKNFFVAIALSMIVLIGWNVFFGLPNAEKPEYEVRLEPLLFGQYHLGVYKHFDYGPDLVAHKVPVKPGGGGMP